MFKHIYIYIYINKHILHVPSLEDDPPLRHVGWVETSTSGASADFNEYLQETQGITCRGFHKWGTPKWMVYN